MVLRLLIFREIRNTFYSVYYGIYRFKILLSKYDETNGTYVFEVKNLSLDAKNVRSFRGISCFAKFETRKCSVYAEYIASKLNF